MAGKQIIDFTNVKEGGNFSKKKMPAGDYLAKVTKVEDTESKSDKVAMWLFTLQLANTPSATYPYYCKLQENQLWKVRNLLVAAGLNVPKKRVSVDPNKLVGKTVAVSLDDTEYEGKEQSEIGSIFSPRDLDASVDDVDTDDDDDDEDEAEEEPKPKKKKKAPEPEPEEDDEEEEDEEPEPPKKKKKKKAPEPEPEDDDDDEEEEEEPAPKPKKKKKAAPPPDDDDDEIEIEDLDD